MQLKITAIKTRKFLPPKDNIFELLDNHLPSLKEGDLVFITSKVLAIHQGRCIKISDEISKEKLVRQEADYFINRNDKTKHKMPLTIKNNTFVSVSGIDESNSNGYYTLWPKDPNQLLKKIHTYLTEKNKIKKLGVITTDSHVLPLRRGVTGVPIGFYGFEPIQDLRGTPDIFGRKLKYTQVNLIDPYAAMAVQVMGEGGNQTPIVLIRGAENLKFVNKHTYSKIKYPLKEDIYYPILKSYIKNKK